MKTSIEQYGQDGVIYTPTEDRFYRPGAECTSGDRRGSEVTWAAVPTMAEARRVLAEKQQDPEESVKYDSWFVVRGEVVCRWTVVKDGEDS